MVIGIGDYRVGAYPMATIGLGSCIALVLHDRNRSIGGMAHIMLPASNGNSGRPAKFADTALDALISGLEEAGGSMQHTVAKIVGGACMFEYSSDHLNIGDRNAEAVRELLKAHRIRVAGEETGGKVGRSILYQPAEGGTITIRRADGTCGDI
ncbi:chemotaxis protein ched [hydrocarbon metagenome]|uniref:Chemotaxis protein ched n=1 Tax=hydrocarbon metagenome TaxID=938273 RepID=A0A0W8FE32_9ZZZZ|nr:chemotaxis protein CheD [Methanomicrobiaceae archaeon]